MSWFEELKQSTKTYIIAEAGVNHNGDVGLGLKLIDAAKAAGADAVKFQTFRTECVIAQSAPKAAYQKQTTGADESQFAMVKKLELNERAFIRLKEHCSREKIQFLSTPFDEPSVGLLRRLDVPFYKIPSGEITNVTLLAKVAVIGRPIILSTGMCTLSEVADALDVIKAEKNYSVVLLHCVTAYPAPIEEVNLKAMLTLAREFNLPVGYSDHTLGTDIAPIAVALGARVIEKHFTLDKSLPGPDHAMSLDPAELKTLVTKIRQAESALGDGTKRPSASEKENIPIVRRSVVAAKDILPGTLITWDMLTIKRPGMGIAPQDLEKIIGRTAEIKIKEDTVLTWDMLKETSVPSVS